MGIMGICIGRGWTEKGAWEAMRGCDRWRLGHYCLWGHNRAAGRFAKKIIAADIIGTWVMGSYMGMTRPLVHGNNSHESQSWWWMWLTWFANGSQGQSKGQRPSPAQNFILRPNYFVKITAYISLDNRLEYKRAETEGRYKILKFWNVIFCWYWIERLQSYHYIFWPVLRRVGQRRRLQQPSSLCPIPLWNNCFLLKENKFS